MRSLLLALLLATACHAGKPCDLDELVPACTSKCASTGGCFQPDSLCRDGAWECFCEDCPAQTPHCDPSTIGAQCGARCASTGGWFQPDSLCNGDGTWTCFCADCPADLSVAVDLSAPDDLSPDAG